MTHVMSILGTRPEAIKMAPVIKELEKYPAKIRSTVVVTAQHREMLDQVLGIFDIKPDYDLNIMSSNQTLADVTIKVLKGMEEIFSKDRPDVVLVQGDTTTVLAGALAAFYHKIKIGHVEAGLRTNNLQNPWPEEMNRRVVDSFADFYFCPTILGKQNLIKEGIPEKKIFVTGNTVIDALLWVANQSYEITNDSLKTVDFSNKKIILLTTHRRENYLSGGMKEIYEAIKEILKKHQDVEVVFPVHLNPNVRKLAHEKLDNNNPRVHLVDPLDYRDLVKLMKSSCIVLTDSGGIQEEAPSLGKPVVILRETTERPEGIEAGTAILAGTRQVNIFEIVDKLLSDKVFYGKMSNAVNPYGDGKSAWRIVDIIKRSFEELT
ncbi:MAG: UDP-N-acetylglucosamine 2-epimerase (non-hydrolyzing) [Patescibacteria group bacterium]|nr:UDP-N-acetylglucosamine 2-epimerase (non-hydrolyzing) [Patescibacteria group bacterium]